MNVLWIFPILFSLVGLVVLVVGFKEMPAGSVRSIFLVGFSLLIVLLTGIIISAVLETSGKISFAESSQAVVDQRNGVVLQDSVYEGCVGVTESGQVFIIAREELE